MDHYCAQQPYGERRREKTNGLGVQHCRAMRTVDTRFEEKSPPRRMIRL